MSRAPEALESAYTGSISRSFFGRAMSGVRRVEIGPSPHAAAECHRYLSYIPAFHGITKHQVHGSIMQVVIRKRARSLATWLIGKGAT